LGSVASRLGLADVIEGAGIGEAVVGVTVEASGSIDLLTAGSSDRSASDLLSSPQAASVFRRLQDEYDLVIIDGPPLLTVAYSTTLVRFADQVLVVVLHGQEASSTQDLRHQLEMIGTPVLGYVYNYAPLRAEMALTASSFGSRTSVGSDDGPPETSSGA
jgi:Mrp family chromosome partitioning ATPase